MLDPGGNNVVIVRSTFLHKLIEEERETGVLEFDVKTPEDVYTSQAGNYRHRREGLSVRIDKADRDGVWHPRKRTDVLLRDVAPKRKRLYLQRELLSSQSHEVFLSTRKNPVRFAIKMASNEFRYYAIDNRLLRGMVKFAIQVIRLALRLIRVKVIK